MVSSGSFTIENKLIVYKFTGEINSKIVVETISQAVSNPDFKQGLHIIYDLRGVTSFVISQSDLELLREKIIQLRPVLGENYKVAYVTDNDMIFGFTRMYKGESESILPFTMQSFRDYGDALNWIDTN